MTELKKCSCCRRKYNISNFKKKTKTRIYKTCMYCRKIRSTKKPKTITAEHGLFYIDWGGTAEIIRLL